MDAFYAGVAIGFGVLLFGRITKGQGLAGLGAEFPGLLRGDTTSAPGNRGIGAPGCGCDACDKSPAAAPTALTPFSPSPVMLAPGKSYTGGLTYQASPGVIAMNTAYGVVG